MSTLVPNREILCQSGIHLWRVQEDAARCCAGWIPIRVPFVYRRRLADWALKLPSSELEIVRAWVRVLIPEHETELIKNLRLREPDSFRSSTGPANPWLKSQM